MKLKTYILPPKSRLDDVCNETCRALLEEHFDPVWNVKGRDYTAEELDEFIEDAEVLITSWGSPIISPEMLVKAKKLKMLAHAAGSLKGRIPPECFDQGVKLFSAAPRIAQSVGEFCLAALMSALRKIPLLNHEVHSGNWKGSRLSEIRKGRELTGQTIGIVSASSTARAFIRLLAPFNVNILIYDPFLTDEAAQQLNARKASLEEVMSCPIISIHAPKLESTYRMINKQLISRIPDNAILINSSRADVLDEEALIAELQTGRFTAALDVFTKEPLPEDSPFLKMDNVILTPHAAGGTVEGYADLMQVVVEDMLRSLNGEPTRFEVKKEVWSRLA